MIGVVVVGLTVGIIGDDLRFMCGCQVCCSTMSPSTTVVPLQETGSVGVCGRVPASRLLGWSRGGVGGLTGGWVAEDDIVQVEHVWVMVRIMVRVMVHVPVDIRVPLEYIVGCGPRVQVAVVGYGYGRLGTAPQSVRRDRDHV